MGPRDGYIHWAQEMFDKAGMLREIVKWDYELRNAEQLATVVDRALAIAATEPRGPVYLSLPREVIAAPCSDGGGQPALSRLRPAAPAAPDASAIDEAADVLAGATHPLIGGKWAATRRHSPRSPGSPSASQFPWFSIGRAISRCRRRIR